VRAALERITNSLNWQFALFPFVCAFFHREPVPTPYRVRGRLSRKNALVGLALLALTGCSSLLGPSGPAPVYYGLNPPRAAAGTKIEQQLLVEVPRASLDLDTTRIAVLQKPNAVEYYADVLWRDRVPQMLQTLLVRPLDGSGRFRAVAAANSGLRADLLLLTDVAHFEAEAFQNDVRVELTARLVRAADRSIVDTRLFSAVAPSSSKSFDDVVAAYDRATSEVLVNVAAWAANAALQTPKTDRTR
jgi:cholesterol transport system auxiliary component